MKHYLLVTLLLLISTSFCKMDNNVKDIGKYIYQIDNQNYQLYFKNEQDYSDIKFHNKPDIEVLLNFENDLCIISIAGYYTNYSKPDLWHDGEKRKIFYAQKVDNSYYIISSYNFVIGYIEEIYLHNDYLIINSSYYRGGSGGGDNLGFIKIFKLKDYQLINIFDEHLSYEVQIEGIKQKPKYAYLSFSDKDLNIIFEDKPIQNVMKKSPLKRYTTLSNPYITYLNSNVIAKRDGVLTFNNIDDSYYIDQNEDSLKKLRSFIDL